MTVTHNGKKNVHAFKIHPRNKIQNETVSGICYYSLRLQRCIETNGSRSEPSHVVQGRSASCDQS